MSQVDSRRVVDELLVASHHTCCICKDERITPQIHHIDNDRTNNDPDNLVPLCPNCHDRVATRYAFTRRYTPAQVKLYRNGWFQLCKQADQKVAGLVVEREETIPTDWVVAYGTNTNEVRSVLGGVKFLGLSSFVSLLAVTVGRLNRERMLRFSL